MKRLLTALLVMALCVCATSAFAADGSWERVKNAGQLVIGLDDAFPPMGFRDDNAKLVGFDIDTAEEVGKRLGIKIVWQPTEWKGVINSLYAKKFDCIWNGMTITPERQKKVAFSKPYLIDGQIATVRMDEKAIKALPISAARRSAFRLVPRLWKLPRSCPRPLAKSVNTTPTPRHSLISKLTVWIPLSLIT